MDADRQRRQTQWSTKDRQTKNSSEERMHEREKKKNETDIAGAVQFACNCGNSMSLKR